MVSIEAASQAQTLSINMSRSDMLTIICILHSQVLLVVIRILMPALRTTVV